MDRSTSLLARLTVLPIVLALIAVIAYGGLGLGRDTTLRTHSLRNAQACLECHRGFDDYQLLEPMPSLCAGCHPWEQLSPHDGHAEVETSGEGCAGCHDVHGKTREPFLLWPGVVSD